MNAPLFYSFFSNAGRMSASAGIVYFLPTIQDWTPSKERHAMKRATTKAIRPLCAMIALTMGLSGPARAQSAPPDIVVTAKNNGKDITLHGNQRLIVRLSESPNGYGWSALMTPDSILAFTDKPEEKKQPEAATGQLPMVGGASDRVFAFRPASYTESSSQWFMLIYCGPQCNLKDRAAKIFKIGVKTQKN
jgi:hypothetical protein